MQLSMPGGSHVLQRQPRAGNPSMEAGVHLLQQVLSATLHSMLIFI